jgi:hypothetical protein
VRARTPAKMHAPAGVSENLARGQLDRAVVLADVRCSSRRRFVQSLGPETRTVLSVQTAGCPGSQQREKGLAKGRMGFTSVRVMMTLRPRPRLDSGCRRSPLLARAIGLTSDHDRCRGRC